jgi:Lon-like protease
VPVTQPDTVRAGVDVDAQDVVPEEPPLTARAVTLAVAMVATSLLVAICSVLPAPYAVASPGPTRDTLGEHDGEPLIQIEGEPTYDSTGQLLLTTVRVGGGPGFPVTLTDVLRGWWDAARSVVPVEAYYQPTDTRQEIDERNQEAMISSQENATVAALEELGYTVPTVLEVYRTAPDTGADGVLEPGDVIVAVGGTPVESFSALSAELDAVEPGSTVVIGVVRNGTRTDLEVVTTDDGTGRSLLGVIIDPEFDLPVDVRIAIENIGGSSAGTMFALGIIDSLTEADETGGETIAGTGTINLAGEVGPIGSIRQKLVGATRDGATWFLAPESNCEPVVGHVPDGLRVVKVTTLAEARAAVEAIGAGEGEDLPSCTD